MTVNKLLILIICLLAPFSAQAELVVIVNPENNVDTLNKEEVIDLFMGRFNVFPDGRDSIPLDQKGNSEIRKVFYNMLTGKSIAQINAYWARLLFTGRAVPPIKLKSSTKILEEVRNNTNSIAYIDSTDVDETVKVIFRF
jgi:ABC-type phosphate transport system substrate-binding protein